MISDSLSFKIFNCFLIVTLLLQFINANTAQPSNNNNNRKSNKKYQQTKSSDNVNSPYEKNTVLYNDLSFAPSGSINNDETCHLNIACDGKISSI